MHNAPSVTYPVGRSLFAACLYAATWGSAALAIVTWTMQSQAVGLRHAGAAAALAFAAAWLALAWWRSPTGDMSWSGAAWQWVGDGAPAAAGHPVVRLDLQRWLLLEWRGGSGGVLWLWAERRRLPVHWQPLRRAVYSPARTEASREAQAPLAGP
jgi:toxin CptA